jgi:hypothetical protein
VEENDISCNFILLETINKVGVGIGREDVNLAIDKAVLNGKLN